jgi:hypothetical protein
MKEAKTLSMLAAKRERFEAQNGLLPKKEEIKGEVKGEISKAELAEVEQFLRRNVFRTLDPRFQINFTELFDFFLKASKLFEFVPGQTLREGIRHQRRHR